MHYSGPSTTSHVSFKVRGSSHSQVTSPAWSEQSFELSPLALGGQVYPRTPSAPSLASVPLPSAGGSSSTSSGSHGLATPLQTSARSMHPILVYDPTGRLLFNVNFPLTYIRFRPNVPPSVLNDQATSPPTSRVCINVVGFPRWGAEVINPAGVTVRDVLHNIHVLFDRLVGRDEFMAYSDRRQNDASHAFNARTTRDPSQRSQGIKRVDFLNNAIFFVGLSRPTDGSSDSWHINMSAQVA